MRRAFLTGTCALLCAGAATLVGCGDDTNAGGAGGDGTTTSATTTQSVTHVTASSSTTTATTTATTTTTTTTTNSSSSSSSSSSNSSSSGGDVCGDGMVTGAEGCDDGNTDDNDGCAGDCSDTEAGFTCDLTAMPNTCVAECGDGLIVGGEACDDGNFDMGDGCADNCTIESGWTCTGTPSVCSPTCGDNVITGTETCDGTQLNGETCVSQGLGAGTLACNATCDGFDTSGCTAATVNEIEPNEDGTPQTGGSGTTGNDFDATAVANADANGAFDADVTINGALNPAGDEDVFAFTNPSAGAVDLRLDVWNLDATFGIGTACAASIDTVLTIRDAAGANLAQNDDRVGGGVDQCSGLGFALQPGETVYVHLSEFGDDDPITSYALVAHFAPLVCGDSVIGTGEECDDGNTTAGDGCDATCLIEHVCGDGHVVVGEECDDGNTTSGDGCSSTCHCENATCALGTCAGTIVTGTATGLPVAVPDNMPLAPVSIPINIAATGTITKMAVSFSATHTFDADLDFALAGPGGGADLDICSDNGSTGDNFTGTVLADGFPAVTSGSAPFTGVFAPEHPFSTFNGQPVTGTWTLKVDDDASTDTGSVTSYGLAFCVTP